MIQRPRLHIIDDDPQYCELVKFHLKNYFLISISNGGFEGYSRTKSQRPDVIILDQHMEGWNGIQTFPPPVLTGSGSTGLREASQPLAGTPR